MATDPDHGDQEPFLFESIGIGPAGRDPVEFVPVQGAANPTAERVNHRISAMALGVGLVAVIAVIVWATTRSSAPDLVDDWEPHLPTDPSEAFVWTPPTNLSRYVTVAGTADHPFILTIGPTSGTVYALDGSGRERWKADIGSVAWSDAYRSDDTVVVVSQNSDRYSSGPGEQPGVSATGFDADSGARQWTTSVRGNYWTAVDGHILVFTHSAETVNVVSIAMDSGDASPGQRYDSLVDDGATGEMLVQRGGELFTVDVNLNQTSIPVVAGDGIAAAAGGKILSRDDNELTIYDTEGATIRHSDEIPESLEDIGLITGQISDVWLYVAKEDTASPPDCGAFRFAPGDDGPVDLWRHDDCFLTPIDDPAGADDGERSLFGLRSGILNSGVELVDLATGAIAAAGSSIEVGTNGVAIHESGRIVGHVFGATETSPPLFEVPVRDSVDLNVQLIGGALAVTERGENGKVSVTVYR